MKITKTQLKKIIAEEIEGVRGDRPLTELFGWGKKKKKEPEAAPEPVKGFEQQKGGIVATIQRVSVARSHHGQCR